MHMICPSMLIAASTELTEFCIFRVAKKYRTGLSAPQGL